jgi:hypothetical protein
MIMRTVLMLFAAMVFSCAQAQQSPTTAPGGKPPAAAPSPDQLEPAVDTTATTTPDAAPARASAAASAGRLTPKGDKAPAAGRAAGPRTATTAGAGDAAGSAKDGARGAKGPDRVELETTDITGNRELPKVLYIVPWKRSDLGDLVGKPANSLLDEVLQPIDRDVFLRENRYYDAVKPDVPRPKAGTVPGSGDKP